MSRLTIQRFDPVKHQLSESPTNVYLAKLFHLRIQPYSPGDDSYKPQPIHSSWDKSVFLSAAGALVEARKARGNKSMKSVSMFIEDVPAIAIASMKSTLLISDFEQKGKGIPELSPLPPSLREVAEKVVKGRSTTVVYVTGKNFPVMAFPFRRRSYSVRELPKPYTTDSEWDFTYLITILMQMLRSFPDVEDEK